VKQLQGILPICTYCKKIRDDANFWQRVEAYISAHSDARFSHGICPQCWDSVVVPQFNELGLETPDPSTVPADLRVLGGPQPQIDANGSG
jgi:phosphoserine phosphatase RsbU/P